MKLSVLIPTYNYDCTALVGDLLRQLPADAEILVGDDGSTDEQTKEHNRTINQWPQCRLWESPQNIGRAAIRNRLADMAQGERLIFLDSDAQVVSDHFIDKYLQHSEPVVSGGICHAEVCPKGCRLRWKYERQANTGAFTTFNFCIDRKLFLFARFDETIREYGHEDTLFGMTLQQHGFDILRIDNPMRHMGLDSNSDYLHKCETALRTMSSLYHSRPGLPFRIARVMDARRHPLCCLMMRLFHRSFSRIERWNLLSSHPFIPILQLYKLGYYASI